jgi:hypothetical protein
MIKTFILLLIFIVTIPSLFAQKATKAAYVELGGAGIASINYDMRIMKKNDGLGFRIGIGGFSINNGSYKTTALFVPVGLNYLLGKDNKHFFELGAGATFVSLKEKNTFNDPYYQNSNDRFNSTFGHLYFGYRVQPKDGGFLFRAGLTPIFGKGYFIPYWAGVSFGYAF